MNRATVILDYAQRRLDVQLRRYNRVRRLTQQNAASEEEMDCAELVLIEAQEAVALAQLDVQDLPPSQKASLP